MINIYYPLLNRIPLYKHRFRNRISLYKHQLTNRIPLYKHQLTIVFNGIFSNTSLQILVFEFNLRTRQETVSSTNASFDRVAYTGGCYIDAASFITRLEIEMNSFDVSQNALQYIQMHVIVNRYNLLELLIPCGQ